MLVLKNVFISSTLGTVAPLAILPNTPDYKSASAIIHEPAWLFISTYYNTYFNTYIILEELMKSNLVEWIDFKT